MPEGADRAPMRLLAVTREVERFVAGQGWDQNPRLFALARTADLVALEPEIAEALGPDAADSDSWTPIEQELPAPATDIERLLATTGWPPEVAGAALVVERLMLPPGAEASLGPESEAKDSAAAAHPDRQDVRIAVAVTRDGARMAAVRLRSHDDDGSVLFGEDLVSGLAEALAATLR